MSPENQLLLDQSFESNGLREQIENDKLLLRLKEKVDVHQTSPHMVKERNLEFVMVICSNILLDEITLECKEFIVIEIFLPILNEFAQH